MAAYQRIYGTTIFARPSARASFITSIIATAIAAGVCQPALADAPPCPGTKECSVPAPKVAVDPQLTTYVPTPNMSGTLSIFGSDMGGEVDAWIEEFKKYQPNISFTTKYPTSDGAAAGLIGAGADIGSAGREAMLPEHLAFNETFGYDLFEAPVATGSYNVRGKTPSVVIYVNKDNPIAHMTLDQVDGVFGSERAGGYLGFHWRTERGRGPEKNIRTWGQLGLKGEWASKPIQTYGYAQSGMTEFFQRVVFKGGDKWNPNYQEAVESYTKMVPDGDFGPGSSQYMLQKLTKDKYAIGWSFIPSQYRMQSGEVKAIAIGTNPSGPFYAPNLENSLTHKYPLTRSVFFYLKKDPKTGVAPLVREFMRFIYSKQGQSVVARRGVYLPLTAEIASAQLARVLSADAMPIATGAGQ